MNPVITKAKAQLGAIDQRLRQLETATNAKRDPLLPQPLPSPAILPGVGQGPPVIRETVILELADMTKLGWASRHDYLTHPRYPEQELRIDAEVPPQALQDILPRDKVLVHAEHLIGQRVEEIPTTEFGPVKRKVIQGTSVDIHWKATILPAGAFAEAQRRDAIAEARRLPRPQLVTVNRPARAPAGPALVDWLRDKQGVALRIAHGQLTYTADRGVVDPITRQLIRDYRELLAGWVTGHPVPCYACATDAVQLLEPGWPACAEHAR